MASRKLEDLHPVVQSKVRVFLEKCAKMGIDVLIYCTYRSIEEQQALYAQGRNTLAVVNALRKAQKLSPITIAQNINIVTKARGGESMHNFRLAFDVVPLQAGKAIWDENNPVWLKMGKIGKECGLDWAGGWRTFREFPHFQYTGNLSLKEIQAGAIPT